MHALIIEDDDAVAGLIADILREHGFSSFDFAASEHAAVEAARTRRPDQITADVELNPGSGIAAVQRICADRPVPVIYVTASFGALSGVPSAFIVAKPFTDEQLGAAVAAARASVRGESPPARRRS